MTDTEKKGEMNHRALTTKSSKDAPEKFKSRQKSLSQLSADFDFTKQSGELDFELTLRKP
jgi:hypothetical protein